jgi:S1-C subfamily serine protease
MIAVLVAVLLADAIPVVESKDFPAEVQRAAVTATVRIRMGSSSGSGVIIARDRVFVYILTAHHVIARTGDLEVATFSAASYPGPEKTYKAEASVVARSKEQDLALIRLTTDDKPPGSIRVGPLKSAPAAPTFPALTLGCSPGAAPRCQVENVKAKKRIQRPDEKGTVWTWEVAEAPRPGRSGGPLLDARGHLLGICSGSSDGRGYYCHLDEILHFLKLQGLEHLITRDEQ